jgi:hypothetical protein
MSLTLRIGRVSLAARESLHNACAPFRIVKLISTVRYIG